MNEFNSEGQTSKLTQQQQQYYAPQPQIMTTQQINYQIDQIINNQNTKHPSEIYRKPPYKFQPNPYVSVNKLFTIGTIMGIIGAVLCMLCVFLPNKITFGTSGKMLGGFDLEPSNIYSYLFTNIHPWIAWVILGIALAILICSIFIKYDYGMIRFIGLGIICYLNYYTSTTNCFSKSDISMAFGYYIMYVGCGILLISAIIILIANYKEQQSPISNQIPLQYEKHPSELYRKAPYKYQPNPYNSINILFKTGTIMGIIGSILCFLCVFMPNRTTYIYHIKDIPMPKDYIEDASYQNLLQIFDSWLGWTILVISIIVLISCIFTKYEFGITRFIGLGLIFYFNYYSGTHATHPKSYFRDMAYGYYLMYVGVGMLLISAIIILIANIKEYGIKKQVRRVTYGN